VLAIRQVYPSSVDLFELRPVTASIHCGPFFGRSPWILSKDTSVFRLTVEMVKLCCLW
jgi:hypothetical protein